MKITQATIDKAKTIRHEAALKWGCATKSIDWLSCVGMAIKGEELPWREKKIMRALIYSGSYLRDCEIATIEKMPDEDQARYIEELRGRMVYTVGDYEEIHKDRENKGIEKLQSKKKPCELQLPGESCIYLITEEEEKEILAENARIKKEIAAKEKAKDDAFWAIIAQEKEKEKSGTSHVSDCCPKCETYCYGDCSY